MRMLERLLVRVRAMKLYKDPVVLEQHLLWIKHLDETVETLRDDRELLLEWIETELSKAKFLSSKYRNDEDVDYYVKRVEVFTRLKLHLELLLTPGAL